MGVSFEKTSMGQRPDFVREKKKVAEGKLKVRFKVTGVHSIRIAKGIVRLKA